MHGEFELRANIERFRRMLAVEPDGSRRETVAALLAEHELRLRELVKGEVASPTRPLPSSGRRRGGPD